jgi:hypothetical protein
MSDDNLNRTNQGLNIFILKYLSVRDDAKNLDFGRRCKQLESSIKREADRYQKLTKDHGEEE